MGALNMPVEMIAVTSREGSLRPVRFRVEDRNGELTTVRLRRIESAREIPYVGIEAFQYVCRAELGGAERLFELRYAVRTHRWVLYRFLD